MDGNGIGKLQLFQLFEAVFYHFPLIKFYGKIFRIFIDLTDNTHITVEYTGPFICGDAVFTAYLPFHLVIIFDLHYLIAGTVDNAAGFFLFFGWIRGI